MTQAAGANSEREVLPDSRQRLAARFGALACLACCVCAVMAALFKGVGFEGPAVFFLVVYILSQPQKVLRSQWIMAVLLIGTGVILAALHGSVLTALWEGGRGTLMFILLFASVTLLQYPAMRSPSMQVVRVMVTNLPPGKRYLWLSMASHFLSAITNFAGFALLASFVAASAAGDLRKRMALALSRGFVAASTWSPFFLAMAVVVSLMPSLRWLDVAAPGILLGLCLILFGSFYDHVTRKDAPPAVSAPMPPIKGRNAAMLRLGLLSAILVGGVAAFDAVAHLSMSATIAIVVTVFSLSWFAILAANRAPDRLPVHAHEYATDLVDSVAGLRGLSVLFIAANILGQGVSAAVDGQLLVQAAAGIGISGIWWIPFLLGVILGNMADENLRRGLILSDGSILPFFTRPLCIFFLLFILVLVIPQIPGYAKFKARLFKRGKAA